MHCQLLRGLVLPVVATTLLMAQAPAPQPQPTSQALKATYDQAMNAKDWPAAIAAAQQLIGANATSENLLLLGNAQLYGGGAEESFATYDRALAAAQQEKSPEGQPDQAWKDGTAKIYLGRGNALLKLKRTADAIDNYNHSAELSSTPGLAYFNICAVLYNTGDTGNSAVACRKCVQADATRTNAWFILGSDLFADAKIDAQGKVLITEEGREALQKYLEFLRRMGLMPQT